MDPQLYVPLDVVAGFKMLRNITEDVDLIKQSLRKSTKIELKESGGTCFIRPLTTIASRNTLILREIPKYSSAEEIKTIFPNPDKIFSVHPDIADTWFVSFNNEEDCKVAYDAVQDATFKGHAVKARIKSENLLKNLPQTFNAPAMSNEDSKPSFLMPPPPPPPPAHMFPSFVPAALPYPYLMSAGLMPFPPPPPPPVMQFHIAPQVTVPAPPTLMAQTSSSSSVPQNNRGGGRGHYRGRGGRGQQRNYTNYPQETGENIERLHRSPKKGPFVAQKQNAAPKLGLQDFPPLPSSSQTSGGYSQSFKRYTKAEIISIMSILQTKDIPVPENMPKDCVVFSAEMITDIELLRPGSEDESKAADCSKKSFAEVAITSKDIKPPEKAIRRSIAKKNSGGQQNYGYGRKNKGSRRPPPPPSQGGSSSASAPTV
jgi:hypothetical protein